MSQLTALLDWYSQLTPASLQSISQYYADEARFKDPFNEVQGISAVEAIFTHMFETTEHPRFEILDQFSSESQGFATWRFLFDLKGKSYVVLGATHFYFDADGKVILHRDYWDAAEELFQKLPLIGGLIRYLRGLFRVKLHKH